MSQVGSQITLVALFVQVFAITGSSAAVGLIGIMQLLPMALVTVFLGPLIDRYDRRVLLLIAHVGLIGSSVLLFAGAYAGDPPLALLYGAAALNAGFLSLSTPTRAAMTPSLVAEELYAPAFALNWSMQSTAAIVGPALGGVIVARAGYTWAYGLDVASYFVAIATVLLLHAHPPRGVDPAKADRGLNAILNGLRFLSGRPVLQSTFYVDIVAMVFGMPRVLFPVIAATRFHQGAEAVGWLFAAVAAGALLGSLSSGWVRHVRRCGLAILVAVAIWGVAITAFGLAGDRLWLAVVTLAIAGGADVISAVFRTTVQQLVTPDALRGRLASFNIFVVAGGPRVGDLEGGVVASIFTPTISVVSGGLLCLAGVALIATLVPRVARWRVGDPP